MDNREVERRINEVRKGVGLNEGLRVNGVGEGKVEKEYGKIKGSNGNLIGEMRREGGIELFGEGYR